MPKNLRQLAEDDQVAAAAADARTRLTTLASALHSTTRDVTGHPWLVEQLHALISAMNTGQGRHCPHIGSPTVLHGAVWAPGHLVCSLCIGDLTPDLTEDSTCDRCRRHADPIYAGIVAVGPLLLRYGLCRHCTRRTGLGQLDGHAA